VAISGAIWETIAVQAVCDWMGDNIPIAMQAVSYWMGDNTPIAVQAVSD